MRVTIFTLISAIAASPDRLQLAPIGSPTISQDPWQCATEKYNQYFQVPTPTGDLHTALVSYGKTLITNCVTIGVIPTPCPYPEKSRWCGFGDAIPPSLKPTYSSYGSSASVWWAAHSTNAVSLARECPNKWYKASVSNFIGGLLLNQTINFAECYGEQHAAGPETSSKFTFPATHPEARGGSPTGSETAATTSVGSRSSSTASTGSGSAVATTSRSYSVARRDANVGALIFKVVAAMF